MNWKRIVIISVTMLATGFVGFNVLPRDKEVGEYQIEKSKGISKLNSLNSMSLQTAQNKVKKAKQKIVSKQQQNQVTFSTRFENSVILGDSMPEALIDYRLLFSNTVLAIRGRRSDTCDEEINKAIQLSPQHIFLCYGMNDIPYYRKNITTFITNYTKQINKLKKALPNSKIYINSIIPMADFVYRDNPIYRQDKKYNQELQKMCEQLHVNYIDNSQTMNWTTATYEFDGMHPKFPYYPLWLNHMAEAANI